MRQIQAAFITGYVTLSVQGPNPEQFFQMLSSNGIEVWQLNKQSDIVCRGNIKLKDISLMRKLRRKTHYKVKFLSAKGGPVLLKQFMGKKPLVLAIVASILLVVLLSNTIWDVKITNVPKELEEKIDTQLEQYGVKEGAWALSLDAPGTIQQKLIDDIPELLWVGVYKKGTTYVFEGIEKIVVEEEKTPGPSNLIAQKSGVIEKMYVSEGRPVVHVNDYVEKGDLLVAGELKEADEPTEEDEEEDATDESKKVASQGNIMAKTWYETSVTIPLETTSDHLTGEQSTQYGLSFGQTSLPFWGFTDPDYNRDYRDVSKQDIYFFKWKLPFGIKKTTIHETKQTTTTRTSEEAIEAGKQQAQKELQLNLGPEADIISCKVLHESTERGKVNLILYLTVNEDISKTEPLTQGD